MNSQMPQTATPMNPPAAAHSPVWRIGWLCLAVVAATLLLPWWSVAVVGLTYGVFGAARWRALEAAIGSMLGWGVLLGVAAWQGPVGVLASRLGELFHVRGGALLAVTVLFAALLGWGGAGTGRAIGRQP